MFSAVEEELARHASGHVHCDLNYVPASRTSMMFDRFDPIIKNNSNRVSHTGGDF
jgi:hypothetical protein